MNTQNYFRDTQGEIDIIFSPILNFSGFLHTLGAGIGGVFIFAMVYASNASTAIVIATIAITVSNFSSSGPGANLVELAPKYSSVLMGISNFACNITGFISPEVVGSLTEHGVRINELL